MTGIAVWKAVADLMRKEHENPQHQTGVTHTTRTGLELLP